MTIEKSAMKEVNYSQFFIRIAIGLLIISIGFPFFINCFFSDWSKSGTFGDTFGALNALFSGLALAGVIVTIMMQKSELKNQQHELSLQRSEMQETRKEFLINRTTSLVYNQLDRFERCLNELSITHAGKPYIGNDAISFLNENRIHVMQSSDMSEEQFIKAKKDSIVKLIRIYGPNKSQIEKFAHNAYNAVEVLKMLIFLTELDIKHLNDIKNLFFTNVGFINMGIIEQICELTEDELKYMNSNEYDNLDIEPCSMFRSKIFLKPIKEFYYSKLNQENFPFLKAEWMDSRGEI
ncbi:MAG: hypothetical protein J7604_20475 [Sporocytophaga sp.]|uniref:hypothetical protein n=1 Tax=Sporocytophaga sp. TaxID=2231183 RepID=UPI001B0FE0AD|nr:hypothetical protein [Sporocytophaga sp.]MBO9702599.1 hypothetical protein [Sporocytophaga sp.]